MRALGATVERVAEAGPRVDYRVLSPGADGLTEPDGILDCGNSGTSLRLIAGMLAGLPMTCVLDGDASLRGRPVARIIEPLRSMGAVLHGLAPGAFGEAPPGRPLPVILLAGLLVGLGARLANGCTSGHGILGLARSARRSIVAMVIFVAVATLTVRVVPL